MQQIRPAPESAQRQQRLRRCCGVAVRCCGWATLLIAAGGCDGRPPPASGLEITPSLSDVDAGDGVGGSSSGNGGSGGRALSGGGSGGVAGSTAVAVDPADLPWSTYAYDQLADIVGLSDGAEVLVANVTAAALDTLDLARRVRLSRVELGGTPRALGYEPTRSMVAVAHGAGSLNRLDLVDYSQADPATVSVDLLWALPDQTTMVLEALDVCWTPSGVLRMLGRSVNDGTTQLAEIDVAQAKLGKVWPQPDLNVPSEIRITCGEDALVLDATRYLFDDALGLVSPTEFRSSGPLPHRPQLTPSSVLLPLEGAVVEYDFAAPLLVRSRLQPSDVFAADTTDFVVDPTSDRVILVAGYTVDTFDRATGARVGAVQLSDAFEPWMPSMVVLDADRSFAYVYTLRTSGLGGAFERVPLPRG